MGFQQGLSGLNASSKALDTIGNNIANSGTVGFKNGSAQFADVFAASLNGAGAAPIGIGAKVAGIVQQFTQGNISVTNNPLDTAINGGGFFQMDDGSGGTVYARNGQFQLDKDGYIVSAQGLQLKGIAAVNGVIATGSPAVPLRLFDPTQSLSGTPQATGASTGGSGVQANVNLDSRLGIPVTPLFDYNDPTSYNQSTATTVYDSLGNPHTYSMYFVKNAAANTWDVYATVTNPAGSTPPNPPSLATFQDLGALGTADLQYLRRDHLGPFRRCDFGHRPGLPGGGHRPRISGRLRRVHAIRRAVRGQRHGPGRLRLGHAGRLQYRQGRCRAGSLHQWPDQGRRPGRARHLPQSPGPAAARRQPLGAVADQRRSDHRVAGIVRPVRGVCSPPRSRTRTST
jgi:flagellar hook-basal body protein